MAIQQISMFGFFALIFTDRFWLSCIVFLGLQLFILLLFYSFQNSKFLHRSFMPWLASAIMQKKDIEDMSDIYAKKID